MLATIWSFPVKKDFDQVISNLQTDVHALKEWFSHNVLVLNSKKYHVMTFGYRSNLRMQPALLDVMIKSLSTVY